MPKPPTDLGRQLVVPDRSIVRSSLSRFVLLSLLALLVLGAGIELVSQHLARGEAVRDARTRSVGVANGIAAPLVNSAVRRGDRESVSRLGQALNNRMRDGSFSHMVVYAADGRVLWCDDTALIGRHFRLSREVRAALGTSHAETSLPGQDDRHRERIGDEDSLLEVYVTTRDADGEPFVFEAYTPPDRIAVDRMEIRQQLLPVGLGGLLLFQLAILPLVFSLARRVDRAQRHRTEMLHRSLLSWHEERRRLAQELHDGVIQDLSAASYALPSVVQMLPADRSADAARSTGTRIGALLQQDLRAMRSLIFDLLPADLEGVGLMPALESLGARHVAKGADIRIEVAPGIDVGRTVAGLIFRVVREGLRNVERHAHASNVLVELSQPAEMIEIVITDDGRGLGARGKDGDAHFGLRLLEGMVGDVGGTLDLRDGDGGGAVLEVRIPAVLPD